MRPVRSPSCIIKLNLGETVTTIPTIAREYEKNGQGTLGLSCQGYTRGKRDADMVVDNNRRMPTEELVSGSKIWRGAPCVVLDANTSTQAKDAKERSQSMRKLLIAVELCVIFISVEVAGGIKANSLAMLTDAAHHLSEVAAFAISLFSLWAAGWESNSPSVL
ncbi:hypothetical protein Tsubulata_036554 [Turnera subulata]|uniref:Cation efflux protein transmembrane domain-containing protein n=1 Tax=Turnera subulata TaxID=218843 RepID=A0A9Q0F6K1_9ROSI|nr:hypothetical protein Tsubulata_036554 [Turnera subulata]